MHLLCNAYWLDTDALQGCDLPKIKEVTYGFNQNTDVVATLPPSPLDNFCASAKHNSSPNTYSIDSAALISEGTGCTGSSGTVQTASVAGSGKTTSVNPKNQERPCTPIPSSFFVEANTPPWCIGSQMGGRCNEKNANSELIAQGKQTVDLENVTLCVTKVGLHPSGNPYYSIEIDPCPLQNKPLPGFLPGNDT